MNVIESTWRLDGHYWRRPASVRRLAAMAMTMSDVRTRAAFADGVWFVSVSADETRMDWIASSAGLERRQVVKEEPRAADEAQSAADVVASELPANHL